MVLWETVFGIRSTLKLQLYINIWFIDFFGEFNRYLVLAICMSFRIPAR